MNKRNVPAVAVLCLAVSILAAGCAATKLTNVWKDPDYSGTPRKIMVLAILNQPSNQKILEDSFVRQFKADGIEAVAAHTVLPGDKLPAKEMVAEQVRASGADALLLTRLTGTKIEMNHTPKTNFPTSGFPDYYSTWGGYYDRGYGTAYQPAYMSEEEYAYAESTLYDAASEKLVWSAASTTRVRTDDVSLIQSYVAKIMKSLRKQGLIRGR